jgi:hypothetical protein
MWRAKFIEIQHTKAKAAVAISIVRNPFSSNPMGKSARLWKRNSIKFAVAHAGPGGQK